MFAWVGGFLYLLKRFGVCFGVFLFAFLRFYAFSYVFVNVLCVFVWDCRFFSCFYAVLYVFLFFSCAFVCS